MRFLTSEMLSALASPHTSLCRGVSQQFFNPISKSWLPSLSCCGQAPFSQWSARSCAPVRGFQSGVTAFAPFQRSYYTARFSPTAPAATTVLHSPDGVHDNSELQSLEEPTGKPSVPVVEAPLRFEGEWRRFTGRGLPEYPFIRYDVVIAAKTKPRRSRLEAISLTLEKRGRPPVSSIPFFQRRKRMTGELLASITMDISPTQLYNLLHGETKSKAILTLTPHATTSDPSVTGKIGFEKGHMFIKLESESLQLITGLKPAHTVLLKTLASYASFHWIQSPKPLRYKKRSSSNATVERHSENPVVASDYLRGVETTDAEGGHVAEYQA